MSVKKCGDKLREGLVVFDVEGVLLPKWRYIPFEIATKLGYIKFLKILLIGFLYEIGVISLERTLRSIYKSLKGCTLEELYSLYERIPVVAGVFEVFKCLRSKGWKTALIRAGLPEAIVKDLASKLQADYAFGLKLKTVGNKFTGEIYGDVVKKNGKALVLKRILKLEKVTPENCVLIADDRNNLQLFPYAKLRIGYNPDFMLSVKSDYVVSENLKGILPIIIGGNYGEYKSSFSRSNAFRSTIHIGGFSVPFICSFLLGIYPTVALILSITILYIASEFFRIYGKTFPIFTSITNKAAIKLESLEFAAAPIYYALSIMLSLLIFSPKIAYASIAILTLGDGLASISGKIIGRVTYPFNKTKHVEGTVLGLISAFLGAAAFLGPVKALVGAAIGMLTECLPLPVNDNLTVPLISGFILSIMP